jgi:acetyl esterase
MPLDPLARAYLDEQAALGIPPLSELGPDAARERMEVAAPTLAPFENVESVENTRAASVPVRIYRPAAATPGALVWFHGGGWVLGSLDTHDGIARRLANRAACTLVSVDYRLAPEHRFPAAVEDAWEAARWAGGEFGTISVGGDSAGGTLAAVVALRAREAGVPVSLQVLVYPITDHSFDTASYEECAEGYGLTRDGMRWFWDTYLGPSQDGSPPDASPLRATELAGVAPALVITAEFDPLRDEGEAYAERLREAGVPTTLRRYDGQNHGFFRMAAVFPAAAAAIAETASAVRAALAAG